MFQSASINGAIDIESFYFLAEESATSEQFEKIVVTGKDAIPGKGGKGVKRPRRDGQSSISELLYQSL
jgi:hypothetical protein